MSHATLGLLQSDPTYFFFVEISKREAKLISFESAVVVFLQFGSIGKNYNLVNSAIRPFQHYRVQMVHENHIRNVQCSLAKRDAVFFLVLHTDSPSKPIN